MMEVCVRLLKKTKKTSVDLQKNGERINNTKGKVGIRYSVRGLNLLSWDFMLKSVNLLFISFMKMFFCQDDKAAFVKMTDSDRLLNLQCLSMNTARRV